MKAANTRMRTTAGRGKLLALVALTASIAAFGGDVALAQNAECARLQQRSPRGAARAGRGPPLSVGAANSGGPEHAGSLGCGDRGSLFFGAAPPPQCGEVNAQISRMEANFADLQARAGGGAGDLVARYNAECLHAAPSGPSNVFEALLAAWRSSQMAARIPGPRWTTVLTIRRELRNGPPGQSDENGAYM